MTSAADAIVYIHKRATPVKGDPAITNNIIYGGGECGLLVTQQGKGTIRGNQIFGNAGRGIQVDSGCYPIVEDNEVLSVLI